MNADKEKEVINLLPENDFCFIKSVTSVNHKPHPYVVGPRHISVCADHFSGMLGEYALKQMEKHHGVHCAHPQCYLKYDEHTFDTVAFVQLKRDCTDDEMRDLLTEHLLLIGKGVFDGYAFVDTDEKFRIINSDVKDESHA